ncbi:hypothetical protein F5Y11DRAFT_311520 [Daldinia sp. FL1419]|nr:hypothetical protein F5Y11DRAFT_311520 [Daldinia sp. FL1419]
MDEWFGVPMPGQFPISNWLAEGFDITRGDGESSRINEQQLWEPQIPSLDFSQADLGFDPSISPDLDLSSLNVFDPIAGQPSSLPEEQSGLSTGTLSEQGSAENLTGPDFVCAICGVSFSSQGKLNAHNRRHRKNHRCTECDWKFSEARDLRRHIQSKHRQESEKCPQCGDALKRRDNLRRHMTRYCKYRKKVSRDRPLA